MRESQIQKEIITYLKEQKYKVHRVNSGKVKVNGGWMQLFEEGTPDILVFGYNSYILWIEVKKPGEVPTAIQNQRKAEYDELGHDHLVATSLDDVINHLNDY